MANHPITRNTLKRLYVDFQKAGSIPLSAVEDLLRREPVKRGDDDDLYVVRLWDGFDHLWIDVIKPTSWEDAVEYWKEKTDNGMEKACFDDLDYYAIYPADTRMLHSAD